MQSTKNKNASASLFISVKSVIFALENFGADSRVFFPFLFFELLPCRTWVACMKFIVDVRFDLVKSMAWKFRISLESGSCKTVMHPCHLAAALSGDFVWIFAK